MTGRYGLPLGILLTLALASFTSGQSMEEAAMPPLPANSVAQTVSMKGIVTAKGERSIGIRANGSVLHVLVTPQTRVTGQRASFLKIAVSDIVRVEGTVPSTSHIMTAHEVAVLFAAESTERSRAKRNTLWDWIKNGGVTVDLP